jgi:uncharacterized membrane protein
MKRWIPDEVYNARPWFMMAGGAMLCLGSMLWSMVDDKDWSVWLSGACLLGAGLIIGGGVLLLRRQQYRARSKWRRTMLP